MCRGDCPYPWGMEWTDGAQPDFSLTGEVTIERVRSAADLLASLVHRTPVMTSASIDELVGASVFLKCENLQRVGAFKIRGATNAMARLSGEQRRRGVLAFSSGNHAQGVALAAATLGAPAVIVMPTNAPKIKLDATWGYLAQAPAGSEVILYDPDELKREELGRQIVEERGLTLIPPYDHPDVICGQGTAALELFEEVGQLDALYVPCGGGGLLSGSATAARAVCPSCEVIGVEPVAGDDATRSFADKVLRTVRNPDTIADGARTPYTGRYTLPIILERVSRMMTVGDAELARLVLLCMERMKLVIEPSGVLGLAGAVREARAGEAIGAKIGVIVSGGNVDLSEIGRLRKLAGGADKHTQTERGIPA